MIERGHYRPTSPESNGTVLKVAACLSVFLLITLCLIALGSGTTAAFREAQKAEERKREIWQAFIRDCNANPNKFECRAFLAGTYSPTDSLTTTEDTDGN